MAAPLGNKFWKARSSHGRAPIFASPEELWKVSSEYFEWVEENPLYEDKIISFQGVATHVPCSKMRAMTVAGLCIFLDIDVSTWFDYAKREDFTKVTSRVEQIIRDQKFTGAAADLLNANIIARDLGLVERQEHTGKDGGPIETANVTDIEAARAIAFVLQIAVKKQD